MNKVIFISIFCIGGVFSVSVYGATITAVNNGPWSTNSTWSCNCQPTNADNVVIPVGKTVSITAGPVILTGGPVITITINGTLSLNSGGTLIVDSNDIVKVNSGGKISATGILDAVWSGGTPIFIPNGTSINGPSTITSGSLPITLLFFTGREESDGIILEWASASEKNFDFYAIERSVDGEKFDLIDQVKGAGYSTERLDYSYEDEKPVSGISYYRLKSVDLDGTVEIFKVVRMEFHPSIRIVNVFPNPVTGNQLHTNLNFYPEEGNSLILYGLDGKIVLQQYLASNEKEYLVELPASAHKGFYFVVIATKETSFKSMIAVY